jgi:hypothetical protein
MQLKNFENMYFKYLIKINQRIRIQLSKIK